MITRRPDERPETFEETRARFDEQAQACRAEQDQRNAEARAWDRNKGADQAARELLGRLRRSKSEIDPEGRL